MKFYSVPFAAMAVLFLGFDHVYVYEAHPARIQWQMQMLNTEAYQY